jgi:hypothetical protein
MSSDRRQCKLCRRYFITPGNRAYCSTKCNRAKKNAPRDTSVSITVKPVPCGRCKWGTKNDQAWLGYVCELNAAVCRPRYDARLLEEVVT